MSRGGQQEVVMLFNTEGTIQEEMVYSAFEDLLTGKQTLDSYAASVTRAAYCVVGNGLSLRGVVFFLFNVDENGVVDQAFNLPLRYLVQNAGIGEDLGQGAIRKASRAQCPVPWHAVNLWEPADEQGLELLQKRIYRNKLKLKTSTGCRDEDFFPPQEHSIELVDNDPSAEVEFRLDGNDINERIERAAPSETNGEHQQDKNYEFSAKLTEVFGEAGKLSLQDLIRLHTDQLDQAKAKYREDVETQQLGYLDQLRTCREEIHALKVALRQEQGRSRRLQQMLRGDI